MKKPIKTTEGLVHFSFNLVLRTALFFSFISFSAHARVLVNQPSPYFQQVMGNTSYTLYYAGDDTGTLADHQVNTGANYLAINTAAGEPAIHDQANLVYFDVSSDTANFNVPASGGHITVTLSTANTPGNEIPIRRAQYVTGITLPDVCLNTGQCQASDATHPDTAGYTRYKSAIYNQGSVLRIGVSLYDICNATGATGSLCASTNAYTTLFQMNLSTTIYVTFGVVPADTTTTGPVTTTPVIAGTVVDNASFTLAITDIQPGLGACPTGANYYFPGDGQVKINIGNFLPSAGTASSYTGAPVQNLIFLANIAEAPVVHFGASTISSAMNSNTIAGYLNATAASQFQGGFKNATSVNDAADSYSATVYAQDLAGLVSPETVSTGYCDYVGVSPDPNYLQAQPISGVLSQSKCFIATTAFHDGRAAPVMMLRKFRDQILAKNEIGRAFIQKYYQYSPALAEWAWDKPIIRSLALKFLAPVEVAAWLALKIAGAEEVHPEDLPDNGVQPYIDRLRGKIMEEDSKTQPPPPSSGSYSEDQKMILNQSPDAAQSGSAGYTEQQRALLPPAESSVGHTVIEKEKLPPAKERESPITVVKERRDHGTGMGELPKITEGFSFKLGVSPGIDVTGGKRVFNSIYKDTWNPDVWFHYELPLYRSENFGTLAVGGDFGFSYAGGFGQLLFPFNGTTDSETSFSFLQVPLLVDLYYRFNLFRILRPYVSGGLGALIYEETRNDDKPDIRGYSFVYQAIAGVALLLDFADSYTARESYLSEGIQHTYLFVEYDHLDSLSTGVQVKRNGIYSGFLFEI